MEEFRLQPGETEVLDEFDPPLRVTFVELIRQPVELGSVTRVAEVRLASIRVDEIPSDGKPLSATLELGESTEFTSSLGPVEVVWADDAAHGARFLIT